MNRVLELVEEAASSGCFSLEVPLDESFGTAGDLEKKKKKKKRKRKDKEMLKPCQDFGGMEKTRTQLEIFFVLVACMSSFEILENRDQCIRRCLLIGLTKIMWRSW
jgi:hypothetical protein